MELADIDYHLPEEAIAQEAIEPRDAARLLVDGGPGQPPVDRCIRDLPDLLQRGDVLVVNETRVMPARLEGYKRTGGAVEVLLLEPAEGGWRALVRPGRRTPPGTAVTVGDDLTIEIGERLADGERLVRLVTDDELGAVARHGNVPLPPYIRAELRDAQRYQTVYARPLDRAGSAAAPTAGLHFTPELLERCRTRGVAVATVDLTVGMDTFRPVTTERVEDHPIHSERYLVPADTMAAVEGAGRVVAVGTTVVRALETAAATGQLEGRTSLFIHGGHQFRAVDVLLTNFHLPRSSLLALVHAFVGPRWRELYATALERGYRFLSFGDAMLLERRPSVRIRTPIGATDPHRTRTEGR